MHKLQPQLSRRHLLGKFPTLRLFLKRLISEYCCVLFYRDKSHRPRVSSPPSRQVKNTSTTPTNSHIRFRSSPEDVKPSLAELGVAATNNTGKALRADTSMTAASLVTTTPGIQSQRLPHSPVLVLPARSRSGAPVSSASARTALNPDTASARPPPPSPIVAAKGRDYTGIDSSKHYNPSLVMRPDQNSCIRMIPSYQYGLANKGVRDINPTSMSAAAHVEANNSDGTPARPVARNSSAMSAWSGTNKPGLLLNGDQNVCKISGEYLYPWDQHKPLLEEKQTPRSPQVPPHPVPSSQYTDKSLERRRQRSDSRDRQRGRSRDRSQLHSSGAGRRDESSEEVASRRDRSRERSRDRSRSSRSDHSRDSRHPDYSQSSYQNRHPTNYRNNNQSNYHQYDNRYNRSTSSMSQRSGNNEGANSRSHTYNGKTEPGSRSQYDRSNDGKQNDDSFRSRSPAFPTQSEPPLNAPTLLSSPRAPTTALSNAAPLAAPRPSAPRGSNRFDEQPAAKTVTPSRRVEIVSTPPPPAPSALAREGAHKSHTPAADDQRSSSRTVAAPATTALASTTEVTAGTASVAASGRFWRPPPPPSRAPAATNRVDATPSMIQRIPPAPRTSNVGARSGNTASDGVKKSGMSNHGSGSDESGGVAGFSTAGSSAESGAGSGADSALPNAASTAEVPVRKTFSFAPKMSAGVRNNVVAGTDVSGAGAKTHIRFDEAATIDHFPNSTSTNTSSKKASNNAKLDSARPTKAVQEVNSYASSKLQQQSGAVTNGNHTGASSSKTGNSIAQLCLNEFVSGDK